MALTGKKMKRKVFSPRARMFLSYERSLKISKNLKKYKSNQIIQQPGLREEKTVYIYDTQRHSYMATSFFKVLIICYRL